MRAAVLHEYGGIPALEDWDEPEAGEGQVALAVLAAALNPVDVSIASGHFYAGSPGLPYVPGLEGVGRDGAGRRLYFSGAVAPHGAMAERTLVEAERAIEVPEAIDPALAVCFGTAGLAAWLALTERAGLREGERVLVLGASGAVGQIAVQAARLLGAGRVVAAARSWDGLTRARELGADAVVSLAQDDLADTMRAQCGGDGPDVIVDPLWGAPAVAALEAAAPGARLVQIGQSAGAQATIASAPVRGKQLDILGHTNFSAAEAVKRTAYLRMLDHAIAGELVVEPERLPLDDVADAWRRQREGSGAKLVLLP